MAKRWLESQGLEMVVRSHEVRESGVVQCGRHPQVWLAAARRHIRRQRAECPSISSPPILAPPDANRPPRPGAHVQVKDEGFEVAHDGYTITIFSAPNYCDQMVGGVGNGWGGWMDWLTGWLVGWLAPARAALEGGPLLLL